MTSFMLSTVDNPFNPFTNWDEWYKYDTEKGYNTSGLLARLSFTSNGLPESINQEILNLTVDEIIKDDELGLYIKVKKDDIIRPIALDEIDRKGGIRSK